MKQSLVVRAQERDATGATAHERRRKSLDIFDMNDVIRLVG